MKKKLYRIGRYLQSTLRTFQTKRFLAKFVSGKYTPAQYNAHLSRLERASFDELEQMAAEYEAQSVGMYRKGPSKDWIDGLDRKLEKVDSKKL